jgi:pimeloyl-ACP methyl ester carboxylesterase
MPAEIEPIVGRYLRLNLSDRPCRVYFEEAGKGIPLVCLHTAGSDTRQYRHLMVDPVVTEHYRVLAFDLPWHGKSTPPAGWHDEEYRLTTEAYCEGVMSFCRVLQLESPVVMGCSMGGRIVIPLAAQYGKELRAVIGLEAAYQVQSWFDNTWLHHPDVHGGEIAAARVSGLIAPQSPEETRWETLWGYMQSGPGVFKGDLYFYFQRAESEFLAYMSRIDTETCPVYLMAGEYDYSCTPEDTKATGSKIPGAEVIIMKEMGHFPMSENPELFQRYILPVLEKIRRPK